MSGEPTRSFLPLDQIPEAWRARLAGSWQMRALLLLEEAERRTDGKDPMFRILLAALHKEPPNLPIFGPAAYVTEDGRLMVHQFRKGWWSPLTKATLIGKVQEVVDALDLNLQEAQALCRVIEQWIMYDKSDGQMRVEDRIPGVAKPKK